MLSDDRSNNVFGHKGSQNIHPLDASVVNNPIGQITVRLFYCPIPRTDLCNFLRLCQMHYTLSE